MRLTKSITVMTLATLAAGGIAACSGTNMNSAQHGSIQLQLTDAPFSGDSVQSVNVFVVRVDARMAAADSVAADSATAGDSASTGGWTTLATPNDTVNLLAYQNGNTLPLGTATLPVGNYAGFRLVIDPSQSSVVLKDGTVLTGTSTPGIMFPSAARTGIKINLSAPIAIAANDTTAMLIDFRVDSSFVMRGNTIARNGLLFTPVIQGKAN